MLKLLPLLFLSAGCASFTVTQTDFGGTNRTTKVEINTLFDSHNDVSKLRTTFTDKSQGISLGGLSESSTGTNAIEGLKILRDIVQALPK